MTISVPAKGWYVEVDHSSGTTLTPDVAGTPSRNPAVNDYPRIEIPVRKREVWNQIDIDSNDVPMRVWFDGERQPIDSLERVTESEGATQVLKGRGGTELETVYRNEVTEEEAHLVAEDVIQTATSYTANVDAPNVSVSTNEQIDSADTTAEIENRLAKAIPAETPAEVANGELTTVPVTFIQETENLSSQSRSIEATVLDSAASNGEAVEISTSSHYVEATFQTEHTIPSGNLEAQFRVRDTDGDSENPALRLEIDGTEVFLTQTDWTTNTGYFWSGATGVTDLGDLEAGTHTVRLEIRTESTNTESMTIDLLTLADDRWNQTYDNSVDSDGYLSGPETKPDSVTIEFDDVQPLESVAGGRLESTWDDTSNAQAIALSNDQGASYPVSASNADTVEGDFASLSSSLRFKVTLSRYGSRTTATPTSGFNGQSLQSYTLKADLDPTPLVVDQQFDGPAAQVLSQIAEDLADFLWEYRISADGTTESVEFAEPEQRTTDRQEPIESFETTRSIEEVVRKVTVKGSGQERRAEPFTANHGTFVDLENDEIITGQESVYDPSTDTEFIRGSDYVLDGLDGRIKTIANGDMSDGSAYEISYSHRAKETYDVPNTPASARHIKPTFPQLPSRRACGQVARLLGEQLDDELQEGVVTIPSDVAEWSVIEAVDFDELPFNNIEIREIKNTPEQTVLRLGSRNTIGEEISSIRNRLEATAQRI